MMRILNEERVEYSKGKMLDLEFLLNKTSIFFKRRHQRISTCKQHLRPRLVRVNTRDYKPRTRVHSKFKA